VVLVTAPPFSAFLAGNVLKREFQHLKLISDFRDSWLDFYLKTFDYQKSESTRRRAEQIERETIERSDFVVTVTQSIHDELRSRYPEQAEEKFALIPNGYDPEVFASFEARAHGSSKIIVTHLGTVYGASSPRYFLDALEAMPEEIREAFEVHFVGRITADERAALGSRRCAVRVMGFVPQIEALRYLEKTDYALLVMTDPASLTGKLFEYLATGKPILAVSSPEGEVARVMRETGGGWCADPNDQAGLQEMIRQTYRSWHDGNSGFQPNWTAIRSYARPRLAAEFSKLITEGSSENAKVEIMR
jgi:glycosyltransferase involved in cell wall biosynthesis